MQNETIIVELRRFLRKVIYKKISTITNMVYYLQNLLFVGNANL